MSKWDGITHNSWLSQYRSPFGAVTAGTKVSLFLRVQDCGVKAKLRLWMNGAERIVEGTRCEDGYAFELQAPEKPCLIWYYFILETDGESKYYGGESGEGRLYPHIDPPAWQITVYEAYETPEWFREGICYQIFPDRFARAGADLKERARYHENMGRRILRHEDWNEPLLYKPLPGEKDYDPCDFYGGDLEGIREKLPYLKELGIKCIYLNPVFESPSNHRYNTSDYEKVDPLLGGDEALKALAREAREQGIRLMLDGVFSHTGDDSVYFNKYAHYPEKGAYQSRDSKFFPWYDFIEFPDMYHSWWGFRTLPELRESTPEYMAFVASLFKRYAAMGITSWRLDVADELPDAFIAFLRKSLKELDKDGVLLGEVWEDASNKEAYGELREYVYGRELDSAMDYPFRNAVVDFLLSRAGAHELARRLNELREHYPKPFYEAQMNLLGSHDTVRILTALSGAPDRDALSREEQALYAPSEEDMRRARARLVMAAAVQMSLPGVPCIYYGDEAGAQGMADPFCRGTYPWGHEDKELLESYRKLTGARSANKALMRGGCALRAYGESMFAILRSCEDQSALLLINRSESYQMVCACAEDFREGPDEKDLFMKEKYRDLLSGAEVAMTAGSVRMVMSPLSAALLISQ